MKRAQTVGGKRLAARIIAAITGLFARRPKRTVIETPLREPSAPRRPSRSFWEGRTKIAPGMLRRARRIKNRRQGWPIDRSGWARETTTVALTHREPDGTRSTFAAPVWTVERAPWAVRT